MSQNIDLVSNNFLNYYLNEVVDKEFEFIVRYQVIPLVFEYLAEDNVSMPLVGNSTVFSEDDCCEVGELRDYLINEFDRLGFSFCDLSISKTLRAIKMIKEVLREVEKGPESADKIRIYLESLSEFKKSFFAIFSSKRELIIKLLLDDIWLDHNYCITNIELSSIIDPRVRPEISKYINEVVRNNMGFISKYKVLPLIISDRYFKIIYSPVEVKYDQSFIVSVFDRIRSEIDKLSLDIKSTIGFIRYIEELDILDKFISLVDKRNSIEIETIDGRYRIARGYLSLMRSLMEFYIAGLKVVDIRYERGK